MANRVILVSGMIFLGRGESELVNGYFWDSFGDLLAAAFCSQPVILGIVLSEENQYMKYYSFAELNSEQFNTAIRLIRDEIASWGDLIPGAMNPEGTLPSWQWRAKNVWEDICEPLVARDERYTP